VFIPRQQLLLLLLLCLLLGAGSSLGVVILAASRVSVGWDNKPDVRVVVPDLDLGGAVYEFSDATVYVLEWDNPRSNRGVCGLAAASYQRAKQLTSEPGYYAKWAASDPARNRIFDSAALESWVRLPSTAGPSLSASTFAYGWPARMMSRSVVESGPMVLVQQPPVHRDRWVLNLSSVGIANDIAVPTNVMLSGLVLNSAAHSMFWMTLFAPVIAWRRFIGVLKGRCPRCDYDLVHDYDSGCPECGWNRATQKQHDPDGAGSCRA